MCSTPSDQYLTAQHVFGLVVRVWCTERTGESGRAPVLHKAEHLKVYRRGSYCKRCVISSYPYVVCAVHHAPNMVMINRIRSLQSQISHERVSALSAQADCLCMASAHAHGMYTAVYDGGGCAYLHACCCCWSAHHCWALFELACTQCGPHLETGARAHPGTRNAYLSVCYWWLGANAR